MFKFHGSVKTERAVAVGCSAIVRSFHSSVSATTCHLSRYTTLPGLLAYTVRTVKPWALSTRINGRNLAIGWRAVVRNQATASAVHTPALRLLENGGHGILLLNHRKVSLTTLRLGLSKRRIFKRPIVTTPVSHRASWFRLPTTKRTYLFLALEVRI